MPAFPSAEVAGALELQLLAVMQGHPGALGAAFFAAGEHDRGDQAEGDGVVHALGWGVERLGGLALVEVVDQPAGEAAAVAGGDAARERAPRREVAVGGAAAAGAEVDALEGVPGDQHPAVARVVDVDPAVAVADFAGAGEHDLAAVEQRHQGAVARAARDGADGVETQAELTAGGVAVELVGADALLPVPLDEAGECSPAACAPCRAAGRGRRRARGVGRSSIARIRRLSRSTTPRLPSHTRTPSSKSLASKRSRSNTVPLFRVTRTSRPLRLDARDVAEARHEKPAEVDRAAPGGRS